MPAIQDTYSVDVRNRYDLGFPESDEDSQEVENVDPLDQLRKLEEERERERLEKKQLKLQQAANKKNTKRNPVSRKDKDLSAPKKEAEVAKQDRAPPRSDYRGRRQPGYAPRQGAPGNNDERLPPRRRNMQSRGGREGGEGERRSERPYYYRENRVGQEGAEGEGRPERPERFRGSRGGGYRGSRGGGYRGGRDDRGKREFERRSGNDKSSVRPSDKREGGGSHNWGTAGNEFDEVVNEVTEAMDGASVGQEAAVKPEGEAAENADQPEQEPEEPEPVEMTLDEFRAAQALENKKKEFNIRQAGEGESHDEWKNLVELKKVAAIRDDDQEDDRTTQEYRRQFTKTHVDLDIQFSEQHKPRGRGRGGPRGRGGRGGGRGRRGGYESKRFDKGAPPIPDVQNEAEFPTLG